MQIRRRGYGRNQGWTTILQNDSPQIDWDKKSKSIKLQVMRVRDPQSTSTHNYLMRLSIGDVQRIVEALAEKGIADCQPEISEKFSTHLDKLLKIMMCSVGVVPQSTS